MKTQDLTKGEYGKYYEGYIQVLGEAVLLDELKERRRTFDMLLQSLNEELLDHRYASGKWSVAELILHIIDTERIFQYRALRLGRGDSTELPGFDQDLYVGTSGAAQRTLNSLREEYLAVRLASITLFESFSDADLLRRGVASGNEVSVRALGFMISGHQKHHENILVERYL